MLLKPNSEKAYRLLIDFFFRSLANVRKNRAIGIALSGSASDSGMGTRYIKTEGGLTIAQEPDTAEFMDSRAMPSLPRMWIHSPARENG